MRRKLLHGKMLGVLAAILALFMAAGVAEEERTDASGQWKYVLENGGAIITGYVEEPTGDLVIPGELDGYPVTVIGDSAFATCHNLTRVTLPDSVTSIDGYAFGSCRSLASVTLPDSVTSIGDHAFAWCYRLTRITLLDNVSEIGIYAFHSCNSLVSVTLPDSVTSIGNDAFFGCDKVVLIVTEGSAAEQYAKENEIPYALLDSAFAFTTPPETDPSDWPEVPFAQNLATGEIVYLGMDKAEAEAITGEPLDEAKIGKNSYEYEGISMGFRDDLVVCIAIPYEEPLWAANGVVTPFMPVDQALNALGMSSEIGGTSSSNKIYYDLLYMDDGTRSQFDPVLAQQSYPEYQWLLSLATGSVTVERIWMSDRQYLTRMQ